MSASPREQDALAAHAPVHTSSTGPSATTVPAGPSISHMAPEGGKSTKLCTNPITAVAFSMYHTALPSLKMRTLSVDAQ